MKNKIYALSFSCLASFLLSFVAMADDTVPSPPPSKVHKHHKSNNIEVNSKDMQKVPDGPQFQYDAPSPNNLNPVTPEPLKASPNPDPTKSIPPKDTPADRQNSAVSNGA